MNIGVAITEALRDLDVQLKRDARFREAGVTVVYRPGPKTKHKCSRDLGKVQATRVDVGTIVQQPCGHYWFLCVEDGEWGGDMFWKRVSWYHLRLRLRIRKAHNG